MINLSKIQIPNFSSADEIPELSAAIYHARIEKILERMKEENLDLLLVYADREHSANLAYCTGFDPRFEEALLLLTREGKMTLFLGNECVNVVSELPITAEIVLCQELSLMGQDRALSWDLEPLLCEAGVSQGQRCGCVGWKSLMAERLEIPSYIVELVEKLSGSRPINANDIFMSPRNGLRIVNEPDQIAHFEYAATRTSGAVRNILEALRPEVSCAELSDRFLTGGLPHSCHPMLACGPVIPNGMASPGNKRLQEGDYLTCAFGIWGALTCRAGLAVTSPDAFQTGRGRDAWQVIENYLAVTRAWYAALHVGVSAGEVWAAADAARDDSLYTFCVNPGHYIHLDEWVSSPFWKDSDIALPSGAALQADIIPVSRVPGISVNMEDGIILADAALRDELLTSHPGMFARTQARRRFMIDQLGYQLSEDVLPLSNMPGAYFPCLLDTGFVCSFEPRKSS